MFLHIKETRNPSGKGVFAEELPKYWIAILLSPLGYSARLFKSEMKAISGIPLPKRLVRLLLSPLRSCLQWTWKTLWLLFPMSLFDPTNRVHSYKTEAVFLSYQKKKWMWKMRGPLVFYPMPWNSQEQRHRKKQGRFYRIYGISFRKRRRKPLLSL